MQRAVTIGNELELLSERTQLFVIRAVAVGCGREVKVEVNIVLKVRIASDRAESRSPKVIVNMGAINLLE